MKRLTTLLLTMMTILSANAQTELSLQEAKSLNAASTAKRWVSVHDPSVVLEPSTNRYYIFGSHRGCAYTTDMQNWTGAGFTWKAGTDNNASNADAFKTPAVKTVKKGGQDVAFPAFNAEEWSHRTDANYNIDGNMWAPDVVWNPTMNKWCMYMSVNGDAWHSSIVLLTSSNITGPYEYQGPVVICGFQDNGHSYKGTDLELVLGTQSSLPARYSVGNGWGRRWPHTIDPAAFYDEEGKLWLVYGSWSGGIWMLELDETTGLRDYDVAYPSVNGNSDGVTSDPYFGTKVAGGYYVSGEGPYIEHIGNYYYLFVSYGFYAPDGGYEMRVFRSEKPNGPYKDAGGRSAIYDRYIINYGTGAETRGEKIMGAYNNWGSMTVGECAQGHNSIIAAQDGRTYLVYHTKFNDGTAGHQVRVHQVFQNKQGWLVAAPFTYNGEQITDADIASKQSFSTDLIEGYYQMLIHKYKMDYANMEEVTPISIYLSADGKITGDRTGTWQIEEGTGYITIKLGTASYEGVVYEETIDGFKTNLVAITAMSTAGINIWAYKMHPKYELAKQLKEQTMPVSDNMIVSKDIDLYGKLDLGYNNVDITWTSSNTDVFSEYGKYNPTGLNDDTNVELAVRMETPGYYWTEQYNVKVSKESYPEADWKTGMLAHYGFDGSVLSNSQNTEQTASLLRKGSTPLPTLLENDPLRTGKVVHTAAGAKNGESYVSMPNPLYGKTLDNGATISFWVKRTNKNLWDALFGFGSAKGKFFMTGNTYIGYNDEQTENTASGTYNNWIDINHPNTLETNLIEVGQWQLVTLTIAKTGLVLYVNGARKNLTKVNGKLKGAAITAMNKFDFQLVLDQIANSTTLYLGNGSFWGSPDACFDDIIVYDRVLTLTQVMALSQMENRVFDFATLSSGITDMSIERPSAADNKIFDLQGRRVERPVRGGIYIINGKKTIVK